MISILLWLALVGGCCLFLWRRIKSTDERLREGRSQREAALLAQAYVLRDQQLKKPESGKVKPPAPPAA